MDAVTLSPVYLSTFSLRREPPRPKEDLEPGYEEKYDFDTLFYDVFLSHDARAITAIFPPLLNCESAVAAAIYRLEPGGTVLDATRVMHETGGVLRLALPEGAIPTSVRIQINSIEISAPVRKSGCPELRDRKTIFMISKNNPLSWIVDWAIYNVRVHEADAILLYDNSSSDYGITDIASALQTIEGFKKVLVVPWIFPFGPGWSRKAGWDSNYAHHRALEHAHWRFCREARAFLNSDIDEMVVTRTGRSVFDHLAGSGLPCITYGGRWVSAVRPRWRKSASLIDHRSGSYIKHTDCLYFEDEPRYPNKWVTDPRSSGIEVEWCVHVVRGLSGAAAHAAVEREPMVEDVEFRHCRQVSINWKDNRSNIPSYRPGMKYDRRFARALARAFPERHVFRSSGGPLRRIMDFLRQF